VSKRWLVWSAVWAVVTAALFLVMNWVLALFVSIVGLTVLVVLVMASDWEQHSTFEERERIRAARRKEKFERSAAARARDREIWEAHRARETGG
jgi:hypothetical protein